MSRTDKHRDFLDVFQAITALISKVHDPQQVMDLVVSRLPGLLEVDAATIRLYQRDTDSFVLGAASGVSDYYLSRSTIASKEVMAALKQGQPIAQKDLDRLCCHENSLFVCYEGVKSAMSLPIIFNSEVIGLLRLLTRDSREFSEDEIGFAMSLAEQVGAALSNGRLFQQFESQLKFLSELREISRLVNSTLDLDKILQAIVGKLPPLLGLRGCTVRLLDHATNRLELAAASGLSSAYLNRGSIHGEDSFFRALNGEPVAIYDAAHDDRVDYHSAIEKEGIKSILVVPLRDGERVIGILRLLTDVPRLFSKSEIDFTLTVAEESGSAIQKAQTYRKNTLLLEQIEAQEHFLHTIIDALWLELLVVGPDRRIIMANRYFLDVHGFADSEVVGNLYDRVVPWSFASGGPDAVDGVFAANRPVSVLDHVEKDGITGTEKWYERHLTPIRSADGQVDFVIEAVRDITDQKLLEQERLEREKLSGVIEMAGTAAHELNSPLFAALGTAQLLRDDLSSSAMIADMDMIIRNMQEMARLTREMTEVTGFESRDYVGKTRIVKLKSGNSNW